MIRISSQGVPVVFQTITNSVPNVSGQVRWNGSSKCLEVCDEYGRWYMIDNNVCLQTSTQIEEMYKWYQKKLLEEAKLEKLAEKYPSVKKAKDHLDTVIKLIENE